MSYSLNNPELTPGDRGTDYMDPTQDKVVLVQSYRFHNVWSLRDADDMTIIIGGPFTDRMTRNGAFSADSAVEAAIKGHWQIVGIIVQDDKTGVGDTNMDAAEGALYRAAHGAFSSKELNA